MRTREFPVLGPEDDRVVDAFAVGLARDDARVLAYLLLCEEAGEDDWGPASRLAVRVGTDLGRERTVDALSMLDSAGLVAATPLEAESTGRPRKGWQVTADRSELTATVRGRHARALVEQARVVDNALNASKEDNSGLSEPEDGEAPLPSPDGESCRLALNWTPNGFHAPVFLASDQGFYEEAGVDLSVRAANGSGAALGRVESGQADVGIVGSAVLCGALENDSPVVPVALLYQRAMTVLYTARSVFGEERVELLDGEADVVTGMAADPPALEADGYAVDSILVSEQFPVPGPALVVHADALADPPAALGGFLSGPMRGVVVATHDREAAAEAVAVRSGDSTEAEHRRLDVALDDFSDSEAVRTHGWGWQSTDDWLRLRMALRQTGALSESNG